MTQPVEVLMRGTCKSANDVTDWRIRLGGQYVADDQGRMFNLSSLTLEDTYEEDGDTSYHFREGGPKDHLYDVVRIFLRERKVRIHIWVLAPTDRPDSMVRMRNVDSIRLEDTSYMMRTLASLGVQSIHELAKRPGRLSLT